MSLDSAALDVWINGIFVLAVLSGAVAVVAILLLVRGRPAGGPVNGGVRQLSEVPVARKRTTITDQAA